MIRGKKKINWVIVATFVCSLLWLMPLVLIFINSFKTAGEIADNLFSLPTQWSLDMYFETWEQYELPVRMGNTLLYVVGSISIMVIIAPMAAYKLARTKGRISTICFFLIFLPVVIPFQSYMMMSVRMASNLGLTGNRLGYILFTVHSLMPLAVYMIHGFVKGIPIQLEECARIDGASDTRIYFSIIFPLLKPVVSTVAIIQTFWVWNDILTNHLIVGGKKEAMNLQTELFKRFGLVNTDWEHALPGIIMSLIPSLIFFLVMQKNIMSGVTDGSVKG